MKPNNILSLFIILLVLVLNNPIFSQNWKKSLGKAKLKVTKKIKKEIKALSIEFKINKVNYNPLKSPNTLNINLIFYGNNPNLVGLSLNKIEFDLYVNDKHISKFYNDKKIKIPKNGNFNFSENADINIIAAGKTLFYNIIKKRVNYKITGTYFVKTSFGTFPLKINLMEKNIN